MIRSGSVGLTGLTRSASGTAAVGGDQRVAASARPITKAEGRVQSASISRRLFSQGDGSGSRTPPAPPSVSTMPAQSGAVSAPAMPTLAGMPQVQVGAPHGNHGRQNLSSQHGLVQASGCPRPSPRGQQGPLGYMGVGGAATVGVPSSPRHRHRAFGAPQETSTAPGAPVRALVSTWEGRSNSQGAPPRRTADPSPGAQLVYADPRNGAATSRAASGSLDARRPDCSSAASRTASRDHREVPMRTASRSRLPEMMEPEPMPSQEDVNTMLNLGMSPMPRQHQTQMHHMTRQAMPSSSPSSRKTQLSVQERIRQLNQNKPNFAR